MLGAGDPTVNRPRDGRTALSRSRAETSNDTGSQTDLWQRPGYLIRRLHQIHVAMFIEECAAFNITPVQYAVMTALFNRPRP